MRLSPIKSALPSTLAIKHSVLNEGGFGIYSKVFIPKGTRFGPYEGVQLSNSQQGGGCCWQIVTEPNVMGILCDQEKSNSNWLKLVNYAKTDEQQNLIAVHCQEKVYYIAHKDIPANSELLVWYSKCCFNGIESLSKESFIRNEIESNGLMLHKVDQIDIKSNKIKKIAIKHLSQNDCNNLLQKCNFFSKELSLFTLKKHQLTSEAKHYNCKICHKNCVAMKQERVYRNKICYACDGELKISLKNSKLAKRKYIRETYEGNTYLSKMVETSSFKLDSNMDVKDIKTDYNSCSHAYYSATVQSGKDICVNGDNNLSNFDNLAWLKIDLKINECDASDRHSKNSNLACSCKSISADASDSFLENCDVEKSMPECNAENTLVCSISAEVLSQSCSLFKPRISYPVKGSSEDKLYDKTTLENLDIDQHNTKQHNEFYCFNEIDKELVHNSKLLMHKKINTAKKIHECDLCDKKFARAYRLKEHKMTHTGEKPYKCDVCGNRFTTCSYVKQHMLRHTGEKPFKCSYCDRKFTDKSAMRQHKRIHTGEKPYQCDFCDKKFTQHASLVKHRRIHTGEKPYECDLCGKRFKQMAHLCEHRRSHIGERIYACDLCDATFIMSCSLSKHKKNHSKLHECLLCDEKFSQYSSLRNHYRIHSKREFYQCDVCEQTFSHKSSMYKHKRLYCMKSKGKNN